VDEDGGAVLMPSKAGSAARIVIPPLSTLVRLAPGWTDLVLRNALKSVPPLVSQVPLVADQVNSVMESGGKADTPLWDMQLAVHLWSRYDRPLVCPKTRRRKMPFRYLR
jgi:hypothetical protein